MVGASEQSHGVGASHARSVVTRGLRSVQVEMTMSEIILLEEPEQTVYHGCLPLDVGGKPMRVHAYVHGTPDGVKLVTAGIIIFFPLGLERRPVKSGVVREKTRHGMRSVGKQLPGRLGSLQNSLSLSVHLAHNSQKAGRL